MATQALPTGVVTLLFTDIEGSTALHQALGADYADALAAHRRIIREAAETYGGVEVDTQGDSFLIAFARASEAVSAATRAQRNLVGGPIRVRMALHTGEPTAGVDGYVGIDLHRGARIGASGHGGQVLLSESTRGLVDAPVRDLGRHRLKDLPAPEHIFQLEIDGLHSDFPLLRTLEAGRTNLPAATTSFVGREDQLNTIADRLADPVCRLLTLVGPGGAGKTRLGVEAARAHLDRYAHGVFHVSLAPISDPKLIALALAEAIGLPIDTMFGPDRHRDDQVISFLSDRSMLILLDNFEHLLDGSELVGRIVEGAPSVDVLVTSRERLGLRAEWIVEVTGLEQSGDLLFVERARQSNPQFSLSDPDRPHVARICRLVEYMPLGIELAAGWVNVLTPAELADEIERNLDVLTAAQRDVPERHRSLRAAFDGSWKQMSDSEQRAFSSLSVFRGSFSREAATVVADADLQMLSTLADKSLIRRLGGGRFELHELMRQYAAERLLADGDHADSVRNRHARYFAGLVVAHLDRLRGADMLAARDDLRPDIGNLREGAVWAISRWGEEEARQLLFGLNAFYMAHAWSEGAEIFGRLADVRSDRRDSVWLRATALQASRLAALNQFETGDAAANQVLPLLREGTDPWDLGQCLLALGTNASNRDETQSSVELLLEGRDAALASGDPHLLCWVDVWLGWSEMFLPDLASASVHCHEALAAAHSVGSEMLRAYATSKLGILADEHEEYESALRHHLDTQASFEKSGDRPGMGYAMSRASSSAYSLGDFEAALRYARAGLDAFSEIAHPWGMAVTQCRVGLAEAELGHLAAARRDLRAALEQAQSIQIGSLIRLAVIGHGIVAGRAGELEEAAFLILVASDVEGLPATYARTAQAELASLAERLPEAQMDLVRAKAKSTSLEAVVEGLLAAA